MKKNMKPLVLSTRKCFLSTIVFTILKFLYFSLQDNDKSLTLFASLFRKILGEIVVYLHNASKSEPIKSNIGRLFRI